MVVGCTHQIDATTAEIINLFRAQQSAGPDNLHLAALADAAKPMQDKYEIRVNGELSPLSILSFLITRLFPRPFWSRTHTATPLLQMIPHTSMLNSMIMK